MTIAKKKHRRARGSGSVYRPGPAPTWWICYRGADGKRTKESSGSTRKADAELLLQSRNGSTIHRLPVVKNAEKLTFGEAAQALIDDCAINHPKSLTKLTPRIAKHLTPFFGRERLASISSSDVASYVAHRLREGIVAHRGPRSGEGITDVSNAQVNRELATLKRIFNLAIEQDRIAMKPHIKLLRESAPRSGFFERPQYEAVLRHLPEEIRPIIAFAFITGWRIASEVLPLQWKNVDFAVGEVRLDAGTTKNREPRTFPMTEDLRRLLEGRWQEHERVKKAGHIVPWVFFREVADERGGEKKPKAIVSFTKVWKIAVRAAGLPGKIPHDLRRTAVRNLVRAGIPERVAMAMTGHKTPSVFQRYNIVSGGDLKEAALKLNAVGGG